MKISPAKRIVVIKPTKLKDTFKTGIIEAVVSKEKDQPEVGKVIAIGACVKKNDPPLKMKKGDIIAYRRYGESRFFLGGEERLFISFDDVLGLIKEGKKWINLNQWR